MHNKRLPYALQMAADQWKSKGDGLIGEIAYLYIVAIVLLTMEF